MISDHITEPKLPTHVKLQKSAGVVPKDSIILLEQVRTIEKIACYTKQVVFPLH